jgi:AcrR family transcriptional regulator
MRKDAQRNREAIICAARELFSASSDVPMYEIAKRAGVGQATLYRNFPDRKAIVAALFSEVTDELEQCAGSHVGDPDAFFVLLRSIVETQARFHGLGQCLHDDSGESLELEALRQRLTELLHQPIRDAKAAGSLRRDVTIDDLFLLIAMIDGALNMENDPKRHASTAARALTFFFDGLAPHTGRH